MVVGSYLITSTHMRYKDDREVKFIGLPNGPPPMNGRLTPSRLKERAELVFQLAPGRMKLLVIVNSSLSDFAMIQACVEVADKYADNVMVIPPLLALLTYAFEDLAKYRNPPENEVLLVVTVTTKFVDFTVLKRDRNFHLHVAEVEHFEQLHKCKEMFSKFYDHHYPHATIFVIQDTLYSLATEIREEFEPENCFIKGFKKWDFVLLLGGILRAMDDEHGFDERYHLANFSHGYQTTIQNYRTKTEERHILLPQRSPLPSNIYGFNGIPQMIKMYYSPEYYQTGDELIVYKRDATKHLIQTFGSSEKAIGYVDERGVPYAPYPKDLIQKAEPSAESSNLNSTTATASSNDDGSRPPQPVNSSPQVTFVFRDNFYGIEVLQNGSKNMMKNSSGNEWTPLYLSMAAGTVEIGEKAKEDYKTFRKFVIFDVLKIIGKRMIEIEIDSRWGFEVKEENRNLYFQLETPSGPRRVPQELIISAFLKAMKLQAESKLDTQLKEIRLSTNFDLTKSQEDVFKAAAAKNQLRIIPSDV